MGITWIRRRLMILLRPWGAAVPDGAGAVLPLGAPSDLLGTRHPQAEGPWWSARHTHFRGGHVSPAGAFKGPRVTSGLCACDYSVTRARGPCRNRVPGRIRPGGRHDAAHGPRVCHCALKGSHQGGSVRTPAPARGPCCRTTRDSKTEARKDTHLWPHVAAGRGPGRRSPGSSLAQGASRSCRPGVTWPGRHLETELGIRPTRGACLSACV